ncbi:hypothetical protein DFQ01_11072 [Paenibacillus cellulosilyticus]|uniref:Uncharacterized protein n=1 Tax=Paenibacillus cellulosilyticus TaxID=375489 RepID=A0A2V2YSI3_9BACL|nr:hypothetical protein [Paenibacillus cellulosilyticus]PWW01182.1 hypothetical protein DFQ01_11072 [Paenibacillus cellulosilyticus]QKS46858.1 hypothetical protein HUB94_20460 [Paenibacillus cellulosilyticus]
MVKTRSRKKPATPSTPSTYTVAGAMVRLREIIKEEFNLDVELNVDIHGWHYPPRLAQLALKDMLSEVEGWDIRHNYYEEDKSHRLEEYHVWSGSAKAQGRPAHDLSIFTTKKKRPLIPLSRSTKNYSRVAVAMYRIRRLVRDLYGVDAIVKISVQVDYSKYLFSMSRNSHVTEDIALEVLALIQIGTDWKIQDFNSPLKRYSNYYRMASLVGKGIEVLFHLPVKKEQVDNQSEGS